MTNRKTASTLNHLIVVLAAGAALMATAGIANAHSHHGEGKGNTESHFTSNMHFANSMHSNDQHAMNSEKKADRKAKKKEAKCKKKACDESSQTADNGSSTQTTNRTSTPTAVQTGAATPGFVTSGKATDVKQTTANAAPTAAMPTVAKPGFVISGQSTDKKAVDYGNGIATISNGQTTSAILNGKPITITSTTPGTFTVSNGTNSVTLNGNALQLANAPSITSGSNLEAYRQKDGSVIFLAKATPAMPAKPTGSASNSPPGVTFGDDVKELGIVAGKGVTAVSFGAVSVPASIAGVVIVGSYGLVKGGYHEAYDDIKTFAGDVWGSFSSIF